MDTTDLDRVLVELKGKLPTAEEANNRTEDSVIPYALSILTGIAKEIESKITHNEKSLAIDIRVELDSPVLSLVVAVLRKLNYHVRTDSSQDGVQVSINWNV
jgi:hypothetical protein